MNLRNELKSPAVWVIILFVLGLPSFAYFWTDKWDNSMTNFWVGAAWMHLFCQYVNGLKEEKFRRRFEKRLQSALTMKRYGSSE